MNDLSSSWIDVPAEPDPRQRWCPLPLFAPNFDANAMSDQPVMVARTVVEMRQGLSRQQEMNASSRQQETNASSRQQETNACSRQQEMNASSRLQEMNASSRLHEMNASSRHPNQNDDGGLPELHRSLKDSEVKTELHRVLQSIQCSSDYGVYFCESFRDPRRHYIDDYWSEVSHEAFGIEELHHLVGKVNSSPLPDEARARLHEFARLLDRLARRIDRVVLTP
jgi:hypothetical protein